MKKIIIPLSIAFALIMIVLSCKKNIGDSDSIKSHSDQISESDQCVEQKILDFKSNLEKPLKSGSGYPIDTAVWYIEALANYTYSTIAHNLTGQAFDSVFIDVTLSNGKVSFAEATSVYNEIIDSLTLQYENLPSQNLHLIFVDVFQRDSVAGNVTFGVLSLFGYGPVLNLGDFDEESDYWTFGWRQYNSGGYCDGPYNGTQTNMDAAGIFLPRINAIIGVPAQRHYPTTLATLVIYSNGAVMEFSTGYYFDPPCDFLNHSDPNPQDNIRDYLMYYNYSNFPNFGFCINPSDMKFYLDSTYFVASELIYDCLGDFLGDTYFTGIDEFWGNNSSTDPFYDYVHFMTNTYGKWIATEEDPEPFE